MKKTTKYHNDFIVDRLTNSIVNSISGDSFPTEVSLLSKEDIKQVQKKNGWLFNWKEELKLPDREVYKLTIVNNPTVIQGLLSLEIKADHVYMHLVESAPFNIGKNKITPDDKAIKDYTTLIKALHEYADYMVINISSPNTPGLRDLQNEAFIAQLFSEAKALTDKPILLKIAPDMSEDQAVALCVHAVESGADGIIATNTTIDYSLVSEPEDIGGLSGEVLRERSFYIFDAIARELYGKTTLISVGGISTPEEAYRRIRAGASLVQIYTSLIFKGPEVIEEINSGLIDLLASDGFTSITEAIGADRQ